MQSKHFSFSFLKFSNVSFTFKKNFAFTFALPVSNRGWKYLKLFRKYAVLIFLTETRAESMTYEPLPF